MHALAKSVVEKLMPAIVYPLTGFSLIGADSLSQITCMLVVH